MDILVWFILIYLFEAQILESIILQLYVFEDPDHLAKISGTRNNMIYIYTTSAHLFF